MGCATSNQVLELKQKIIELENQLNRDELQGMLNQAKKKKQQLQKGLEQTKMQAIKSVETSRQEAQQIECRFKQWKTDILEKQIRQIRIQTHASLSSSKQEALELERKIKLWKEEINGQMRQTLDNQAFQRLKNIASSALNSYRVVCQQCLRRMPKFTQLEPGLKICGNCNGKGVSSIAHKQNDFQKCDKCSKAWNGLFELIICQICFGRGAVLS